MCGCAVASPSATGPTSTLDHWMAYRRPFVLSRNFIVLRFFLPSGASRKPRSPTTEWPKADLLLRCFESSLHFPNGSRQGSHGMPASLQFILRYDMGSYTFFMVFNKYQPGCNYYHKFISVTIWDPDYRFVSVMIWDPAFPQWLFKPHRPGCYYS